MPAWVSESMKPGAGHVARARYSRWGERPRRAAAAAPTASAAFTRACNVPMFSDQEDVDMDRAPAPDAGRFFCPLPSCVAHRPSGHAGWESFAGLKAHMDAHQLGVLPGAPPVDWLRARQLVGCPESSRLVSRRCNGGVHRTRMAARLVTQQPPPCC